MDLFIFAAYLIYTKDNQPSTEQLSEQQNQEYHTDTDTIGKLTS